MNSTGTSVPASSQCADGRAIISPAMLSKAVGAAIRECATTLREDYRNAIADALHGQADVAGSLQPSILEQIESNARIGTERGMPICQDTGSVWICLEVGDKCLVPANVFSEVPNAVREAYVEGRLRMSMVKDALFDRANTNDNNPAFTEIRMVPGKGCRVHVMLKGGGSDNASRLVMLNPSEGKEGIKREVLRCVEEKAANACPPLLVGIGVGSTFDKVAGLSKLALLRMIGSPAESEEAASFESELLDAINATGIGAAALGGSLTAVGVHIKTAPCHIAALPLAINMGCCALRSATMQLVDEGGNLLEEPSAQSWSREGA